jgi:transposase InsO family protein
MLSDNGTQLVGAVTELRKMVKGLDAKKLREFLAEKGMEWRFITPGAPHQNVARKRLLRA